MEQIKFVEAYPLCWPAGYKRNVKHIESRFGDRTLFKAWPILKTAVRRLGGVNLIVSTNIPVRNDGVPYSSRKEPDDTGVAVYFTRKGNPICLCCDQYRHVWENAYAIASSIEAMRSIDRWGVSDMLDRMFTGFLALTDDAGKDWTSVLGVSGDATEAEIKAAYRKKMMTEHPDHNEQSSPEIVAMINAAYERAITQLLTVDGVEKVE